MSNNEKLYELIIVGGGAAGLTAAIYACRAGIDFALIDPAGSMGSQITQTEEIENYPGFVSINGAELVMKLKEHATAMGTAFVDDTISKIEKDGEIFSAKGLKNDYRAKSVIYCGGATHRELGAKGEREFAGRGVSYCATCDGFFFRNKTTVVVGGGDTAVTDALYLSKICKKVIVIHRRSEFRAQKTLVDRLRAAENVELMLSQQIEEIKGEKRVSSVLLKSGEEIETNGVFIAVGITPNSEPVAQLAQLNGGGYIAADESGKTSVEGLFAAGDARTKPLRQVITACADGANCAENASEYLNSKA